ncbi:factor-independent urate hydroxylase [Singulisphaera sp. Ch08]|uniref:Uricase n=1 Tax=Singulisphaera sp. Ch08 TaxID=3120278 RepID=A0AAU7C9Z3_9BACT
MTLLSGSIPADTTASDKFVLGKNQYGKAGNHVVRITSDTARHEIEDLTVISQLRGDFESCHTEGDNSHCVATDTQKNTIFSLARDGVGSPEAFLLRLGKHFTTNFEWVSGGRWAAEQVTWQRIKVDGSEHNHAFVQNRTETRTAVLLIDNDGPHLVAGLKDLTVLKSTGSEFHGFPRDKYTTLVETHDRILSTDVAARWRYNTTDLDFNAVYADVRRILLETFASVHSLALQQTLFQMGKNVLQAHRNIVDIRFSMPNKHHFVVDLAPFGQDNPNVVFWAADRPFGLIEGTVKREDAADDVWESIVGFC